MKAVDNTVRRKWDVEDFEAKAKERSEREKQDEKQELTARQKKYRALDPLHQGRIKERSALERQDVKPRINYAANVGKTQVVNLIGDRSKQGGFYCEVCDILMKDSLAFADHLNGKMHQRLLGMTMRTERVSVNSVKDKFAALKRQREESGTRDPEKEYESRMAKAVEEDEAKRQARKKAKLVKKTREREEKERQKAEEEQQVDEDLMAALWKSVRQCFLLLTGLYNMSPLYQKLTLSISSDTIGASSVVLLILHLYLSNYSFKKSITETLSGAVSVGSAIAASVLLSSRLDTHYQVFSYLSFALGLFVLSPFFRKHLRQISGKAHLISTCFMLAITIGVAWKLSKTLAVAFGMLAVFTCCICPWLLISVEKHKVQISGPWDEAELAIYEAEKEA